MVYLVLPTTIYAYTSNNNYRLISVSELATIHLLKYPTTSSTTNNIQHTARIQDRAHTRFLIRIRVHPN